MSFWSSLWKGSTDERADHQVQASETKAVVRKEIAKLNTSVLRKEREITSLEKTARKLKSEMQLAAKRNDKMTVASKKKQITNVLRKRQMIVGQLHTANETKTKLEVQRMQLEDVESTKSSLDAMKKANKHGKKLMEQITVEEVDDVNDDFLEQFEMVTDINGAMANSEVLDSMGLGDEDMEALIDDLEPEIPIEATFVNTQTLDKLPDAPKHEVTLGNDDDDGNNNTNQPLKVAE